MPVHPTEGIHEVLPERMTQPSDDDDVDVFHLAAPMLPGLSIDELMAWAPFHAGVGLVNTNTLLHVSVEFVADAGMFESIVPIVDRCNDKLTFDDGGSFVIQEGTLDFHYWRHATKLGTIKGADYIKLIGWLDTVRKNFSTYNLLHLRAGGDPVKQPFFHTFSADSADFGSRTCNDAAQTVFQAIKQLAPPGAFTTDPATVFTSNNYLWMKPGTQPRKLDMTPGSQDSQKAFYFWEQIIQKLAGSEEVGLTRQLAHAFETTELPYGVYKDSAGGLWEYEPDKLAFSQEFDRDALRRMLSLGEPLVLLES